MILYAFEEVKNNNNMKMVQMVLLVGLLSLSLVLS